MCSVQLWNVTEFHWWWHHNKYNEMSDVRGREMLLTSGTFDRLYQISISCELVDSIRASSSAFLFVLSTLISFFSFFLPFHLRAPFLSSILSVKFFLLSLSIILVLQKLHWKEAKKGLYLLCSPLNTTFSFMSQTSEVRQVITADGQKDIT